MHFAVRLPIEGIAEVRRSQMGQELQTTECKPAANSRASHVIF